MGVESSGQTRTVGTNKSVEICRSSFLLACGCFRTGVGTSKSVSGYATAVSC